jgi:AbrB family looped-hinge helix DNA binding protein
MFEKITIGRRGAITIPSKVRKSFGMKQNDQLIMETTDEGILLRPSISLPVETYSEERIAEFLSEEESLETILDQKNS